MCVFFFLCVRAVLKRVVVLFDLPSFVPCSLRRLTSFKKRKLRAGPTNYVPNRRKKIAQRAWIHSKLLLLLVIVTCAAIRTGGTARPVIVYTPPNRPRREGHCQLAAMRCVGRVRFVLAVTCPEGRQHDRCALVGDGIGSNLF